MVRPGEPYSVAFDETLRQAMITETELFFDSVVREDRGVLELLTADYTYLNARLAGHYDIPNVQGAHFRRVSVGRPDSPRGGLLGQGSILTLTSHAIRTSPVLRGKWILEQHPRDTAARSAAERAGARRQQDPAPGWRRCASACRPIETTRSVRPATP